MESLLLIATLATTDWRAQVDALARAGDVTAAVQLAETARAPWLAPHLARALPPVRAYVGWVETPDTFVAYAPGPEPWVLRIPRDAELDAALAADALDAAAHETLARALIAPLRQRLPAARAWVFAPDGALARLPYALLTDTPVVLAQSERAAAIAGARAAAARSRPPSLFAFARAAAGDPEALPAALAEIELAASALGGDATLLAGPRAVDALRVAAYDGTLAQARFVLVAAHAEFRGGALALALGADGFVVAADTLHLALTAELVVLSACGTGAVDAFAEAGARAGAALVLVTQWPVDDAAAAQFVGALFAAIARGADPVAALAAVRAAFAAGEHGDAYRHPFHWAGWQLWGGA